MSLADLLDRGPLRALLVALPGGLRPGEVGVVQARPGSGKTRLVMELALLRMLRGDAVLHVAASGGAEQARDHYESLVAGLAHGMGPLERAELRLQVERHRIIHSTRGAVPGAERLRRLLDTLHDVVEFQPRLLVVDGAEPPTGEMEALRALAREAGVAVWWASRLAPDPEHLPDVWLELVPERTHVLLHARHTRPGLVPFPPLRLDSASFVAREAPLTVAAERLSARDCTLYSGGANGAEAAFGEAAERWGLREVNFTFNGHVQARSRGAHPLTEEELSQGEVSLAYVSRRLRRGYGEGPQIRRVLQSLWHQVSRAQLVYVIGTIQEDGTVTGGTGWSVELARMWNKRLWVFDQEKEAWFLWNGEDWVEGTPVIDAPEFCGTGTRYLLPSGRRAIDELMERSFART